jgi:shikimate kinase
MLAVVKATMSRPILLLSGIPGSGKSSYGRWLAAKKQFLHLDLEEGDLKKFRLEELWNAFWSAGRDGFVEALLDHAAPICLDWGFPPNCLPIVQRLIDAGVEGWWFEAKPQPAKKHFLRKRPLAEADFNKQVKNIEASRPEIMTLFQQHIIQALQADGTHVPCEEIYAQMFK